MILLLLGCVLGTVITVVLEALVVYYLIVKGEK